MFFFPSLANSSPSIIKKKITNKKTSQRFAIHGWCIFPLEGGHPGTHRALCAPPSPSKNERERKAPCDLNGLLTGGRGRAQGGVLNRVPFSILFRLGSAQRGDFLIRAAPASQAGRSRPLLCLLKFHEGSCRA